METEKITALDRLHQELNKLEPAIKHIEKTVELTKIIKEIPNKHLAFVNEQKHIELSFKESLKDLASKEFNEVSSHISDESNKLKSLLIEIDSENKKLKEYINKLEGAVKQIDDYDFPLRLKSIEGDLSAIASGFNNVQGSLNNIQSDFSRFDRNETEHFNALKEVNSLHNKKIESLEKLNETKFDLVNSKIDKSSKINIILPVSIAILTIMIILLLVK